MISIIVLAIVFLLISIRRIGKVNLQIWQIMLGGAIIVLLTRQIPIRDAVKSVNIDVMLFLFGMFVVGHALEESGYLSFVSYSVFKRAKNIDSLMLLILFIMGVTSAFLMNDTIAIIGTPVVLLIAKKHRIPPKLMLLTLAYAVTIGSVMSPIGNPQNLLIAISSGIKNPFVVFFKYLALPTIINLIIAYLLLKLFYREHFHNESLNHIAEPITDNNLAKLSKSALIILITLVLAKILIVSLYPDFDFRLTYIALISALPIILFSPKRMNIVKNIDWHTLIFFASMFILMESVWESGFFQSVLNSLKIDITTNIMIMIVSVVMSQLISNVPLVALYLPLLVNAGISDNGMVALAAGSTIAGNLFILGAASNVIIIQNAEKRSNETITFLEFAKVGIPLTIANTTVYWLFLRMI